MKTIKVVFDGKEMELPANNSGWISDSEVKIDEKVIKMLRERPRVGVGPKNEPVIEDDNGKKVHLGSASLRLDGEKISSTSNGGTGAVSAKKKDLDKHARVILDLPKEVLSKIPADTVQFLKDCLIEDTTVVKAKKLLAQMTPEQLEVLKTMFGQN